MRTSATGTATNKPPLCQRRRNAGFTLIELIVVSLILSIIIGATIFSVSVGDRARAKETGQRLVSLMNALSAEAILNGQSYGLNWNPEGRYMEVICFDAEEERWVTLNRCEAGGLLEQIGSGKVLDLPDHWGMSFSVDLDTTPIARFGDVPGDGDEPAVEEDDEQSEDGDEEKELLPWVSFAPTGLWAPDGVVQILVNKRRQSAFRWTATGRVNVVAAGQ